MRFDFQEDRRLMQQQGPTGAPGGASADDAFAAQLPGDLLAFQRANQAIVEAYKTGKPTQQQLDAQKRALEKFQADAANAKLTTAGTDALSNLAKTYGELYNSQVTKSQDLDVSAGQAQFQADTSRINKHTELEGTAAGTKFSLKLMPYQIQMSLFSSVKGLLELINLIPGAHIDTSGLDSKLEELGQKIDNIKMDTSGVDATNTNISAANAQGNLAKTSEAQRALLQDRAYSSMQAVIGSIQSGIGPAPAAAATPAHAITTRQALGSYNVGIKSDIDLSGVIKQAAAHDGNPVDVSPADLAFLNAKVRVASGPEVAAQVKANLDAAMHAPAPAPN